MNNNNVPACELGFMVELLHGMDYEGQFHIDHINELEGIANFHATEYVPSNDITYQIFECGKGGYVGSIEYIFKDQKASKKRELF